MPRDPGTSGEGGQLGEVFIEENESDAAGAPVLENHDDGSAAWRFIRKSASPFIAPTAAAWLDPLRTLPAKLQTYTKQFEYIFNWQLWGAEALDVFYLDRMISPSERWPWWLRYNPLWLLSYAMLVLCFSGGCTLHCLLYQGYPVPFETTEERRFRIHYVYGFDAYLGSMTILFTLALFLLPHKDERKMLALEGIVLSVLWVIGNTLGLMAMYGQSNTGIRCFVAGQLAWTVVLTSMTITDLVVNFSLVSFYHMVVVLFFWVCVVAYLVPYGPSQGLWGLYIDQRKVGLGWHRAAIAGTVIVVVLCSLLVMYVADDLLWYIISGTRTVSPPS